MTFFKYSFLYLFSILSVHAYEVTRLPSPRYTVSEVPHWDEKSQSLYYVDIAGYSSTLNRYDYNENRVYQARVDNAPTLKFILPIKCMKNYFLVGIDNKAVVATWDGRSPKATVIAPLFELDAGTSNTINDVKIDQKGRFYGGTISVEDCDSGKPSKFSRFYTYRRKTGVTEVFGGVFISNGLTWVRKTNKFYYIDSCAYNVKEYDYDPKSGNITNGQSVFSTIQNSMKPDFILDGMTNDVHGNLYLAANGGSKIIKFNPQTREVVKEIYLPANQILSLAFGGSKMDILFVTTGNRDGKQPEASGYLYKVTGLCAEGYPGVEFNTCK